jgi:hypothetical protein
MLSQGLYVAERTMDLRVEEALVEAGMRCLARRDRVKRQGWLSQQGRRLLYRLALVLVTSGGRLVRYGLPPYSPLDGEIAKRNRGATPA